MLKFFVIKNIKPLFKLNKFTFASRNISIEFYIEKLESAKNIKNAITSLNDLKKNKSENIKTESLNILKKLKMNEKNIFLFLRELMKINLEFDINEGIETILRNNHVLIKKGNLDFLNNLTYHFSKIYEKNNQDLTEFAYFRKYYFQKLNQNKNEKLKFYYVFLENISFLFKHKLTDEELDAVIRIFLQLSINKNVDYADKIRILYDLILLLEPTFDEFEKIIDKIWACNLEFLFFMIMNDFRKINMNKLTDKDIKIQIFLLSFFRRKYPLKEEWDKLNSLILIKKHIYGGVDECFSLINVLNTDLKYFNIDNLVEIFNYDQLFNSEEYSEEKFVAIFNFFKISTKFNKFKSKFVKKIQFYLKNENFIANQNIQIKILNIISQLKADFADLVKFEEKLMIIK